MFDVYLVVSGGGMAGGQYKKQGISLEANFTLGTVSVLPTQGCGSSFIFFQIRFLLVFQCGSGSRLFFSGDPDPALKSL